MTTRKHEVEESMRDDTHACPFCMDREADSICDRCSKVLCTECTLTSEHGVLCPTCKGELYPRRIARRKASS